MEFKAEGVSFHTLRLDLLDPWVNNPLTCNT